MNGENGGGTLAAILSNPPPKGTDPGGLMTIPKPAFIGWAAFIPAGPAAPAGGVSMRAIGISDGHGGGRLRQNHRVGAPDMEKFDPAEKPPWAAIADGSDVLEEDS